MINKTSIEREALQRQLEHYLDTQCDSIIKDIHLIKDNINVTEDNFAYMTYIGESLESLQDATLTIMQYIITVKTAEKMIDKLLPSSIKIE